MVKDQDYLKKKASYCIDLAKKLGATDSTAIVKHSISETVNFRNRKLDESDRSDSLGIGLTTYIGKKKSSISSSNLSKDNIKNKVFLLGGSDLNKYCHDVPSNTELIEITEVPGGYQSKLRVTIEIYGQEKPACVVDTISRYYV